MEFMGILIKNNVIVYKGNENLSFYICSFKILWRIGILKFDLVIIILGEILIVF